MDYWLNLLGFNYKNLSFQTYNIGISQLSKVKEIDIYILNSIFKGDYV